MARGGARTGAGRPKFDRPALRKTGVTLSESDIDFLKSLGEGSISVGIRQAIVICREKNAPKSKDKSPVFEKGAPYSKPFLVSQDLFEFFIPFLPNGEKGDLHKKVSSCLAYVVFLDLGFKVKHWPASELMSYQAVKQLLNRIGQSDKLNDLYSALRPRKSEFIYHEIETLRERFSVDAKNIDDFLTNARKTMLKEEERQRIDEENKLFT